QTRCRSAKRVGPWASSDRQHAGDDRAGYEPDRRAVFPGSRQTSQGVEPGRRTDCSRLPGVRVHKFRQATVSRSMPGTSPCTTNQSRRFLATVVLVVMLLAVASVISGAQQPTTGLNIAPVYEGWEQNPDGSL